MKNVYLAGAVRTPIGRFGGALASWTAADLGVAVARESLRRAGVPAGDLNESIWGCARQAGGGPNVARQITYRAGAPEAAPALGTKSDHSRGAGNHARSCRDHSRRRD